MMTSNAVRAANPIITRRCVSTRTPTRQAMPSAEGQLQIRLRLTVLDLAACGWSSIIPVDALTIRIRWLDRHRATHEPITENVAHVVPDGVCALIVVVREDCLADIGLEDSIRDGADF